MKLKSLLGLAAVTVLTAGAAQAQNYFLNFDAGLSGSSANAQAPVGLSFHYGALVPDLDEYGDPIPGTDRWQIDTSAPDVTVQNPMFYDRGPAPSPFNALDSVFSPTLLLFSAPQNLSSFSLVLDNDTFGTPGLFIEFYASSPTMDTLLASLPINQLTPGFIASIGAVSGVNKIVLPGGALYDNLSFSVVPEPATGALLGLGILGVILRKRRY
jgi:hypothetical protein